MEQVTAVVVPVRPGVTAEDVAAWCAAEPEPGRACTGRDGSRSSTRCRAPAAASSTGPSCGSCSRDRPLHARGAGRVADHRPAGGPQRAVRGGPRGPVGRRAPVRRRRRAPCSCSPARATGRSARAATSRRWPTPRWRCRRRTSCPQFGRNIDVPKPTIAAVNGVAYAGGFLLAQQCDLVVAAEHAAFAVTRGEGGSGCAVGRAAAVAGRPARGRRDPAHRRADRRGAGVRDRAGQPGGPGRRAARARRRSWPSGSRPTRRCRWRRPKRTVYLSAPDAAAQAEEIWAPVYRSADAQEGPRAFREKRTPVWRGR